MKLQINWPALALAFTTALTLNMGASVAKTLNYTKSVQSGKKVRIDTFMGWNNDCSFQTINIDVVGKPSSGSATANVINSKISRAQAGNAGKCLGRSIKGLGLYYKSRSGFHGTDRLKVKMKVRGQAPVYFNYVIKVR